jgi:hypothetical protein
VRQTDCAAFVGPDCPATPVACCGWHVVKPGETCTSVAQDAGIPLSQFTGQNPTINAGCTNMIAGCSYCTRMCGLPRKCPDLTPGCTESSVVVSGDTCWTLIGQPGGGDWNQMNRFFCLNNGRINNPSCDNLKIGCTYCTAIPPKPDTSTPCPGGHLSGPLTSGQTCWDLLGGYGDWTKLNNFYDMNPSVDRANCGNLVIGHMYCIPN